MFPLNREISSAVTSFSTTSRHFSSPRLRKIPRSHVPLSSDLEPRLLVSQSTPATHFIWFHLFISTCRQFQRVRARLSGPVDIFIPGGRKRKRKDAEGVLSRDIGTKYHTHCHHRASYIGPHFFWTTGDVQYLSLYEAICGRRSRRGSATGRL